MEIDRAPYSAIIDRPPFTLPGGARVAVWVIVNVEKWDIASPLPRTAAPPLAVATVVPDIPNYSWYDYGNRVGFWRIKGVLDKHGIKVNYVRSFAKKGASPPEKPPSP